jgi:DNA-binding GntR family transcriptional regulator
MVDLADDLIIEAPVSIRQKVYDFLRNQILSNHIAAGERLVEGRFAFKTKTRWDSERD